MIKVSAFYPNSPDAEFDMNYYMGKHIPMVRQKMGPACKNAAVELGLAGGTPGMAATYIAMGHLYFDSVDTFLAAFSPHAGDILGDIPNYTNTRPVIQISEVKM